MSRWITGVILILLLNVVSRGLYSSKNYTLEYTKNGVHIDNIIHTNADILLSHASYLPYVDWCPQLYITSDTFPSIPMMMTYQNYVASKALFIGEPHKIFIEEYSISNLPIGNYSMSIYNCSDNLQGEILELGIINKFYMFYIVIILQMLTVLYIFYP